LATGCGDGEKPVQRLLVKAGFVPSTSKPEKVEDGASIDVDPHPDDVRSMSYVPPIKPVSAGFENMPKEPTNSCVPSLETAVRNGKNPSL
jgi:hypothetical protein